MEECTLKLPIVSRRLQVLQTWDLPPLIFIDPVFSGGGMEAL